MLEPFDGTCFGHALSNVCEYVIIDKKMCIGQCFAFIKVVQSSIQKVLFGPKSKARASKHGTKFALSLDCNL
jgi:hypothetical protein